VKTRVFMRMAILLLMAGAVFAHGDKIHVVGTIEKIDSNSVTVKTPDGKSVEVKLVATTVYTEHTGQQDKAASVTDLAVGNRVVIHATPKSGALEAGEIKFSKLAAASHGAPASQGKPQS